MEQLIVALFGAQGSGKTTIARQMEKSGWERRSFAGPIRECLRIMGVPMEMDTPEEKNTPLRDWGGRSFRTLAQELGTTARIWKPSVWIDATLNKPIPAGKAGVVIDDLRYWNELEALRSRGAWVVRVKNQAADNRFVVDQLSGNIHSSEVDWNRFDADEIVFNDDWNQVPIPAGGVVKAIREAVDEILKAGDTVAVADSCNRWGVPCAGTIEEIKGDSADVNVWNMLGSGADMKVTQIPLAKLKKV